jgi:hypothetical protein
MDWYEFSKLSQKALVQKFSTLQRHIIKKKMQEQKQTNAPMGWI